MNTDSLNLENYSFDTIIASLGKILTDFGLKLISAIVILTVGIWLSNKLVNALKKIMKKRKLEASLKTFIYSFVNILLKIFVFIIVLTTIGVQMTSIIAVLGAASLAIGMALSGTLQNFAGGVIILLFKPFKVGDSIETATGDIGVVKQITIFTTELNTFDNQVVFLPNGALANGVITNLSNGKIRRDDIKLSLAYGNNIQNVRKYIMKILNGKPEILQSPKPEVFIDALTPLAVSLTIRYWCNYSDMSALKDDILENIYTELPKKNIHFAVVENKK